VKGTDKTIILGVVMALVLAGFYFKVLGPKRDEASSLKQDNTELQAQIDQQKQVADFAEDARKHFAAYYGRMVVIGKAVPAEADTASLLVQLSGIAGDTDVSFDALELTAGSSSTASAPAPTTSSSSSGTSTTSTTTTPASSTTPTAATPAATEATAASLPLGASVGPAGLPTMPYQLTFSGKYFDVADFLKGVDDLVHDRGDTVAADGRLLTIDGFSLSPSPLSPPNDPTLDVKLSVTSYVTPEDQGLTAGATPGGPAPAITQPQAQPASATVSP
jgi:Tfp pilus assembly protein PilO